MKSKIFINIAIIALIILLPVLAHADGIDSTPMEPDSAPVDGGLSLLIASGVGYGVKKMKERRTKHKVSK